VHAAEVAGKVDRPVVVPFGRKRCAEQSVEAPTDSASALNRTTEATDAGMPRPRA
jgi:hypothetical protein